MPTWPLARPQVVQEPVENWQAYECLDRHGRGVTANVLEKFYSDPHRYAYSFQHYVLMSRMKKVGARLICALCAVCVHL